MRKIINIVVMFTILGCWVSQGLAYSSDIFYLRVPMGIDKNRAAEILARDGGSKGLPQQDSEGGQYALIDKMEKFRNWARGMHAYILELIEILDDLSRLQDDARRERFKEFRRRFNELGSRLYAFEDIGLEDKEKIGIAHTLKQDLRIIFALKEPVFDVINFADDVSLFSGFNDMKSHIFAIEFDLRRFMGFQRLVITGEPTVGSEGYRVDFFASQKILESRSNPPGAVPAGGSIARRQAMTSI